MRTGLLAVALLLGLRAFAAPDFGVQHDEGQLPFRGGGTLYTESWRGMGKPRGVLVVVPGFKDYAHRYELLANALVPKAIYVYALDLRGRARSTGERGWVEHFDDYVSDLSLFLSFVHSREPGRPVFLFGQGLGGTVALAYALQHPELPGLVLSAPALGPGEAETGFRQTVVRMTAKFGPHDLGLEAADALFSRAPGVVRAMAKDPLVDVRRTPAHAQLELWDAMARLQKSEAALTVPLLVLQGTQDRVSSPAASYALIAHAKSTDKTLTPCDGCFHDLLHEPGHERAVMDVVLWLVNHLPSTRK